MRIATLLRAGARAAKRTRRRASRTRPEVAQLEQRALLADMTAPTTVVASEMGTHGANGWFTSPVTVNFSATDPDNTSSELTTFFNVDGGPLQTGNSLTLTHNGVFVVGYHSQDPAGN